MSQPAAKFQSRSWRYSLRAHDNQLMRVAPEKGSEVLTDQAMVINYSHTGLAFTIHSEVYFHIHEVIKVEVPLSDDHSMACFAKIIRIEVQDVHTQLVAVQFLDLTASHRRALHRSLHRRWKKEKELTEREAFSALKAHFLSHFPEVVALTFSLTALMGCYYALFLSHHWVKSTIWLDYL